MQVPAAGSVALLVLAVGLVVGGAAAPAPIGAPATEATGAAADGEPTTPNGPATAASAAPKAPNGAATAPAGSVTTTTQSLDDADCATDSPPDYADPEGDTADAIGWVDGYWYDEPADVDASDGLQDAERDRFVARTAARVEVQRCLAFEELPPVEVQTREDFAEEIESDYEREGERVGDLMNAEAATMLLIGHDRDWADVQTSVLTGGVGAYYDPVPERITLIVEEPGDAPREQILAHELVHALQDQQFGTVGSGAALRSRFDAERGVAEGDATLVQRAHAARCRPGGDWSGTCVRQADQSVPDLPDDVGVLLLFEAPYLYGPPYVEGLREGGDWTSVNDRYDDLPDHSAYVVAPDRYEETSVELPEIEDRSTDDWARVTASGRPDHDVVGQAALTAMLAAPGLEAPGAEDVPIERQTMIDPQTGQLSEFDQPETSGWRGDRLHAYGDGDDLASVWVLEWTDAEAAERFADAYRDLVAFRGGESVPGRDSAYRLDADTGFDMAVEVRVDGDRVTIVTAPTVDALDDVHDRNGDGIVPGFGPAAATLALLVVALVLARRG